MEELLKLMVNSKIHREWLNELNIVPLTGLEISADKFDSYRSLSFLEKEPSSPFAVEISVARLKDVENFG